MPEPPVEKDIWEGVQETMGWISFILWSLSFYPQCWDNYLYKSVKGFSIEFALLNPVGFYFYLLYNLQGIINGKIGLTG